MRGFTNRKEPLIDVVVVVKRRVRIGFWCLGEVDKFKIVKLKGFFTQFMSTIVPILDVHLGGLLECQQPPRLRALAASQPKRVINA